MRTERQDFDLPPGDDGMSAGSARGPSLVDWASLFFAAALRRKLIAFFVFVFAMGPVIGYYSTRTPLYRVETRLLAQQQLSVPSMVQRSVFDEEPTRAAWELIHRRDNLLSLIKQANLPVAASHAPLESQLALRLFNRAEQGRQDDPLDILTVILDRSLIVFTDGNTITIRLDWPDGQQAYDIVQAAQQNFLEARQVQEITALGEVISLLHERAASLREQLETTIAEVQREASGTAVARSAVTRRPAVQSDAAARLKGEVESKERAVTVLEDLRRRRLADLQAQLDQMRTIYSDNFPAVVNLRKEIAAQAVESPQLVAARAEHARLERQYAAALAESRRQNAEAVEPMAAPVAAVTTRDASSVENDERVREARARYQQMLERVTAAQVDFDTASSAFKHRYKILWPAQLPNKPVSPNAVKILGTGALGALLLALLAAAFPDIRKGRLLRRWQLERALGLPVLATLRRHNG